MQANLDMSFEFMILICLCICVYQSESQCRMMSLWYIHGDWGCVLQLAEHICSPSLVTTIIESNQNKQILSHVLTFPFLSFFCLIVPTNLNVLSFDLTLSQHRISFPRVLFWLICVPTVPVFFLAQLRLASFLISVSVQLYLTPQSASPPLHLTSDLLSTLSCSFDHCAVEWFIFVALQLARHHLAPCLCCQHARSAEKREIKAHFASIHREKIAPHLLIIAFSV